METASITEVKNGPSASIDPVKAGESVVVTDRGIPGAASEPGSGGIPVTSRGARRGLIRRQSPAGGGGRHKGGDGMS